jgi:hypothetical protein
MKQERDIYEEVTVRMGRIKAIVIRHTDGSTRYDGCKPLFQMSAV